MPTGLPPVPAHGVVVIPPTPITANPTGPRRFATRDRDVICGWAARHGAEPATGEATASGPATIDVQDGAAGIRFNFAAAGRFRRISWDEWFANFEQHGLVFVYEEDVAHRAHELWQARGGEHGHDREDWFRAEGQLRAAGATPTPQYRLVKL